jgi:DNA repair exonuclease SbcCD ATPase subunit
MILIKNVSIKNFLSVGQITQNIDLSTNGLTLVIGKNLDIGATNSRNGVGKSTLIQAISYALYGEPISNIRLDGLINNINSKSMLVTIDFEKDGILYRIERGRKPGIMRFFVNGKNSDITDEALGENKHTQVEIERILDMSHTLFEHLVVLSTYTLPFLKLKPADQRIFIEELLGITQLSLRDDVLKEFISKTKENIRDEEATLKAIAEANTRIEVAIAKALIEQSDWNVAQETKILKLQNEIANISVIDFEKEIKLFDTIDIWISTERDLKSSRLQYMSENDAISKEITNLNNEIVRLSDSSTKSFDAQIARLKEEAKRLELEAETTADVKRLLMDIDRRVSDSAKKTQQYQDKEHELTVILHEMETDGHNCSSCGQSLNGTDHLKQVMEKLAEKAEKISVEMQQYLNDAEILDKEAENIRNEIIKVEKNHALKQKEFRKKADEILFDIVDLTSIHEKERKSSFDKISNIKLELSNLETLLAERLIGLAEIDTEIAKLGDKPKSDFKNKEEIWKFREAKDRLASEIEREIAKENPHDSYVLSLQSTLLELDYNNLHDLKSTLKHQDFLHKLLSGKDSFVRKKIVDQNLGYLNGRMNKYLESLVLPHEVKFLPDLSVEISMLGKEFDFEQLSRGEMNRVIIATSWAFRDVWESMNTGLNLVMIDEMLDSGLDDYGCEMALDCLTKMARDRKKNVFLISHRENLFSRANNIIMVHKENQFTRFDENADINN